MRSLFLAVLASVLLAGATFGPNDAEAGGRKRWKRHGAYYDGRYDHHHHHDRYDRDRYISHRELHLIRDYYRPRYRPLPPGLRRHYYRRGYLPRGWQRRIEPYPVYVREVVVLPRGYRRGIIDGHAVIYNSRGLIIDVGVLF